MNTFSKQITGVFFLSVFIFGYALPTICSQFEIVDATELTENFPENESNPDTSGEKESKEKEELINHRLTLDNYSINLLCKLQSKFSVKLNSRLQTTPTPPPEKQPVA